MGWVLTSGVIATLRKEAAHAYPEECCGLLLGEGTTVQSALPCDNVAGDRLSRFEIDPAALIAAHRAARTGEGPPVLGYYHSHPRGLAEPSAEDRGQRAGDRRVWAIVAGDAVNLWRDAPNRFEALSYTVIDG